jgi:hypothetical protein
VRFNIHDDLESAAAVNKTHTTLASNDGMTKISVLGVKAGDGD